MNIVLFRPSFRSVYQLFTKETAKNEARTPEGLLYIAAMLRNKVHNVSIVDGHPDNVQFEDLVSEIAARKPDIVGCGCTTPEFPIINEYLNAIKKSCHCLTVLGGPHATALHDTIVKENPHIDFVVRGEGELTFKELVETLSKGKSTRLVNGLTYAHNGDLITTLERPFVATLDLLPWPARELVSMEKYLYPHPKQGLKPAATMLTSRGCLHKCIFCYSMFGKTVRLRSEKLVVDEMENICETYHINFFIFHDETFTANRSRTMNICKEIIDRKLQVEWYCFTRADCLDEELIAKMSEAGCIKISMGVESGNQHILSKAHKNNTLHQIKKVYRWLNQAGIETRGSFILGLPGETPATIRQTIRFSKSLDLHRAAFNIATPYPGSKLFEMAKNGQGVQLLTEDWGEFKRWGNAVIQTDSLRKADLIRWQKRATAQFYSQPKIIWYHLKKAIQMKDSAYYLRPFWFGIRRKIAGFWRGLSGRRNNRKL